MIGENPYHLQRHYQNEESCVIVGRSNCIFSLWFAVEEECLCFLGEIQLFLFYYLLGVDLELLFIFCICLLKLWIYSSEIRNEKKEVKVSLGETIKQYRVERKMTQEFVAERIGVNRQAVSKWESGSSDPSTSNLIALAKLFDVTLEELLKNAGQ